MFTIDEKMWAFIFLHLTLFMTSVIINVQAVGLPLRGLQQLEVTCDNETKLALVKSYLNHPGFEYLGNRNDQIDLFVTAEESSTFKEILENNHIKYKIRSDDIYREAVKEFNNQQSQMKKNVSIRMTRATRGYDYSYYMNYDEIVAYMRNIANIYKYFVKMIYIGTTYEGRPMYLLHFSNPKRRNNPAIFIDAGIHAREWIAPATALYMIDQLVLRSNRYLLNYVDFYILPVFNPDGYQYTHESPENRLWRKTRSQTTSSSCPGVDLNRNFALGWMEGNYVSNDPCSDVYAGSESFSEPEARIVRDFLLSKHGSIKLYLSLHSYGQYLLYPWSYRYDTPANERTLYEVAMTAARAIYSVSNTIYTVGSSANLMYPAGGGSADWAMGMGGAELSYTIELPGIYEGLYGFILPPEYIFYVGRETFGGLKVFINHVN